MVNRKIRLVLSDIDGTILNDNHELDSELRDSVQTLQKEGIPFVLASARSPKGIFPIAEELALGSNPIACYNGALILEGRRDSYHTIISHELNRIEAHEIVRIIKKNFPAVSINLYSETDWFVDKLDTWIEIEARITNEKPEIQDLQWWLETEKGPVHKLMFIGKPEEIQRLKTYMEGMNFLGISFYLSKDNYLEVTSKEVSKENALVEVANYYNIPLEKVMTIGDNFNDIPMLTLAGIGVAMHNAPQFVKNHADVKTGSNNENGVSKAIHEYVLLSSISHRQV